LEYKDLLKSVKSGQWEPVYFLQGEEGFFIDEITDLIQDKLLTADQKAFNEFVLYGKDAAPRQILDLAMQYPMMADYKLVIVKEAQELKKLDELKSYFEKPNPKTVLVFNYKYKTIDGRTAIGKAISNHCTLFTAKKLYDNQLPDWIEKQGAKYNLTISHEAAFMMQSLLGTDLSKVDKEIQKLSTSLADSKTVGINEVKEHIAQSKDFNVFELTSAMAAKDILKVNTIIQYFNSNPKSHNINSIIPTLTSYFSKVWILHDAANESEAKKLQLMGLKSGFFLKEYLTAAKNYPMNKVFQVFAILHEYDLRSKGVDNKSTSPQALLQEMIFKILH